MVPYVAVTDDIAVTVRPVYLDGQSDVLAHRFVFGYFVRIENRGADEVQLMRRHWQIRDAKGHVQEIEGEGVVGQTPVIAPGAVHEYNSFCIIETFEGSMEGTYLMERAHGSRFRVVMPRFDLRAAAN